MKKFAALLFIATILFVGCSSKEKIVVNTAAPTSTVQPVEVGNKGGDAGLMGGLNKKVPNKK